MTTPPTMVVGQGGGPWFTAAAAAVEPDLVAALVSMDEPFSPETNIADNEEMLPMRWGTAEALRAASDYEEFVTLFADVPYGDGTIGDLGDERVRRNAETQWTFDPAVLAHWESMDTIRAVLDVPELQTLSGAYGGPVLFVSGDPDSHWAFSPEDNENNLRQYPWAELPVLDGTSSFELMRDDPARLAAEITPFLLRIGEATSPNRG